MTCREKLKMEHPNWVIDRCMGGCLGCPHDYGYLDKNYNICDGRPAFIKCKECWDREIPDTEAVETEEPKLEPIDYHHVFNEMAKKHRAAYDSYKCMGFTDEQAFELVRILFEADMRK